MRWLLVVVACVGCKSEPDCAAYANKVLSFGHVAPEREATIASLEESACKNGRVTREQVACVMNAVSEDEMRVCHGLSPLSAGRAPPSGSADPPTLLAPAKPLESKDGVSRLSFRGSPDLGRPGSLPSNLTTWYGATMNGVEECRVTPAYPTTVFQVRVTYTNHQPTAVEVPSTIPAVVGTCLRDAIMKSSRDLPIEKSALVFSIELIGVTAGPGSPFRRRPAVKTTTVTGGHSEKTLTTQLAEWSEALPNCLFDAPIDTTWLVALAISEDGAVTATLDGSGDPGPNARSCLTNVAARAKVPARTPATVVALTVRIDPPAKTAP